MRIPISMLMLFLFSSALTVAQDNSEPTAPVTVIQKKWRSEVRNPAVERNPIEEMTTQREEERQRIHAERQEEIRRQQGMPPSNPPVRRSNSTLRRSDTTPRGLSITYIYEMKVRNTGKKAIRAVSWDYVFFEPGTERELGRRQFISKVRISPGKTGNVVKRSKSSPTGTVDATSAEKDPKALYYEQIVIRNVEYTDGTVWRAASN